VPSPAINGYSLDLMRRDPGEHPNGLIDFALCSTIEHLRDIGARGLSLNFRGLPLGPRRRAWRRDLHARRALALKRLSGIFPIESLWTFTRSTTPRGFRAISCTPRPKASFPWRPRYCALNRSLNYRSWVRFLVSDPSNRRGRRFPMRFWRRRRKSTTSSSLGHERVSPRRFEAVHRGGLTDNVLHHHN